MENKVLLIDDNPSDRLIVRKLVEKAGLMAAEAGDAAEAMKAMESEEINYTLFVVDLQMPKVTGLELVKRLRAMEKHKQTPILILSGKNRPVDVQLAINSGANDYVVKPVDLQIMEQKIQLLSKGSSEKWASYDLPEDQRYTTAGFLATSLSVNEVSATVAMPVDLPVEYCLTLTLDILAAKGMGSIISKIESKTKDPKLGFVYKVNFVGLTEADRKKIRLCCREIYASAKAGKA